MQSNNRVQMAGLIGMAGAVVWLISVALQFGVGLESPADGPLFFVQQILAFIALAGMSLSYVGLLWGGALRGRFGKMAVGLYVAGYVCIILAGSLALFISGEDSPIFLLFPIGGLLTTVGVVATGIMVAVQAHWSGWQRFMPLINAAYVFLAIDLPFALSDTPEGPGMVRELIWGVSLVLVALAVYTAPRLGQSLRPSGAV